MTDRCPRTSPRIARKVKKFKEKIQQEQKAFEKPKTDGPDTLVELTGRARERWRNARGSLTGSESVAR